MSSDSPVEVIEVASGHIRHLWSDNYTPYRGNVHDEATDIEKDYFTRLRNTLSDLEEGARVRVTVEVLPGKVELSSYRWVRVLPGIYGPEWTAPLLDELGDLLKVGPKDEWDHRGDGPGGLFRIKLKDKPVFALRTRYSKIYFVETLSDLPTWLEGKTVMAVSGCDEAETWWQLLPILVGHLKGLSSRSRPSYTCIYCGDVPNAVYPGTDCPECGTRQPEPPTP